MASPEDEPPFAGPIGSEIVEAAMFTSEPGSLPPEIQEPLWELFQQIGRIWTNVFNDSAGQRSSWLEFIKLRCETKPSYLAEYQNSVRVINELIERHGIVKAYERLLLHRGLANGTSTFPIRNRLDHAKVYVVNEFLRVQIIAGGFRGFGADEDGGQRQKFRPVNYNGFIRGSRYNRFYQVRTYRPNEEGP